MFATRAPASAFSSSFFIKKIHVIYNTVDESASGVFFFDRRKLKKLLP
jgi:hypothetical protein